MALRTQIDADEETRRIVLGALSVVDTGDEVWLRTERGWLFELMPPSPEFCHSHVLLFAQKVAESWNDQPS